MADVKWIKITTDIFDDEKILLIESLPDSYAIITVWFKLLCLAGKMNNSGVFMMNNKIAYTDKMLATIFRMKETTVTMALQTFEQFGMIEIIDGVITIPNWGKHQSLDQLEKKRISQREYMREYREKQKQLSCNANSKANCNANSKANVSRPDKNRLEEEKIRLEEDKNIIYCGEYENVIFTEKEFEKLKNEFPSDYQERIENLSSYMASEGKTYSNHLATIRRWAKNEKQQPQKQKSSSQSTGNPFLDLLQDDFEIYEGVTELT